MSRSKKLNPTNINKLNSSLNKKKKVYLNINGEDYEVQIDLKFRRSKIQRLMLDYYTIIQDLNNHKEITDESVMRRIGLFETLAIKYFSDVYVPEDITDIETLVQVSTKLLDLGITEELFSGGENGFPADQIEFLKEQIEKSSDNVGKLLGELAVKTAISEDDEEDGDIQEF